MSDRPGASTLEQNDGNLLAGIGMLAEEMRSTTSVRPELQLDLKAGQHLSASAVDGMLLIARAAVSNVIQHAGARSALIKLACDSGQVVLIVRDTGCGFDLRRVHRRAGSGLQEMAERARLIGGYLAVESSPGGGAEVRLTIPGSA